MPPSSVRQLTNLGEAEVAGLVLGRAFARLPRIADLIPDPTERLRYCNAIYAANTRHCLRIGTVWIAETDSGTIVGVLNQTEMPEPSSNKGDESIDGLDLVRSEWPKILAGLDRLETDVMAALQSAQPEPWSYITVLGVDPIHQSSGIGTLLMQHAIAAAETKGQSIGLMTDRASSAYFYEQFGFQTIVAGHESKPLRLWAMVRPASSDQPGN